MAEPRLTLGLDLDARNFAASLEKELERLRAFVREFSSIKIPAPKVEAPRPESSRPKSQPGGGGSDSQEEIGGREQIARAIEAQERRIAELRKKYSADEVRDEHAATEALIDEIARLMREKVKLRQIDLQNLDAAGKKQLAIDKSTIDKEIALLRNLAGEKKAVVEEGAGARVGILGKFRNVQEVNPPGGAGGGFGGVQFAAFTQNLQTAVQSLSAFTAPFVELDKQVKNIGTLGTKNFQEFTKLSLDLSKKVPDDAATIAAGAYNAISAGITGTNEEIIQFVEVASKVAVAGVSDTNSAVNGLTSVLNAYKLTAADAGTASDTFFAAIKLGKTSFNEMNAGLANVIPAASAAGVKFDEVSAAIAQMTALGVPTSQATTQIRGAIIELQKPGGPLAATMAKIGLNAGNIAQEIKSKGLISTLQRVQVAAASSGKSLTQVFSSSEAASAALLLTGDNAERAVAMLEGVRNEVAASAATGAYEVAATGIEVKSRIIANKIQAFFSGVFQQLGDGAIIALDAFNRVGPALLGLSAIKEIIPAGAFEATKNAAAGLVGRFKDIGGSLSGLGKNLGSLIPGFGAVGAAGSAAGTATGAGFTAALGPVGLIIAAIAVLVGGFILLYKNSETFRNSVDGIVAKVKAFATSVIDLVAPVVEQLFALIGDVAGAVTDVLVVPFEIVGGIVSFVISGIEKLGSAIAGLVGGTFEIKDIFEFIRNGIVSMQAVIAGLREQFKAIKETIGDSFSLLISGDLGGALEKFLGIGEAAGSAFARGFEAKAVEELRKTNIKAGTDALEEQLQINKGLDISSSVAELRKQLASATSEADKANIAEQIAQKVPEAVKGVTRIVDEYGNVRSKVILNEEALDREAAKIKEIAGDEEDRADRQNKVVEGMISGLNVLDQEKVKREELARAADEARLRFGDGSEQAKAAQEALDAQETVVKEKTKQITDAFNEGTKAGLFKDLPTDVQQRFTQAKNIAFKSFFDEIDARAAETRIGETLTEGAKISGELDINKQVQDAIEGFKNAKTEVEKNNFLKVIGDNVPGAVKGIKTVVDENGNLVKQYDVNIDKASELTTAERGVLEARQNGGGEKLVADLQAQAQAASDSKVAFDKLQEKMLAAQKVGGPSPDLQKAYDQAKQKVKDTTQALAQNIAEGRRLGLIKGEVDKVTRGFTGSQKSAFGTADAIAQVDIKSKQAAVSAEDLAKKLQDGFNAAQQVINRNIDAIIAIQLQARIRQNKALTDEEKDRIKELEGEIPAAVRETKFIEEQRKALRLKYHIDEKKEEKKRVQTSLAFDSQLAKARLDTLRAEVNRRIEAIADEGTRELLLRQANLELLRRANEIEISDLESQIKIAKEKRNAAAADEKRDLTAEIASKEGLLANLRRSQEGDLADAQNAVNKALDDFRLSLASTILLANAEVLDGNIELTRRTAEAITSQQTDDVLERAALLRKVEEEVFQQKVRDELAKNETFRAIVEARAKAQFEKLNESLAKFNKEQAALIQREAELRNKGLTDEQVAADASIQQLRSNADAARTELTTARAALETEVKGLQSTLQGFLVVSPNASREALQAQREQFNAFLAGLPDSIDVGKFIAVLERIGADTRNATKAIDDKTEKDIADNRRKVRAAYTATEAERDRDQKLEEINTTKQAELDALKFAEVELLSQAKAIIEARKKVLDAQDIPPEEKKKKLAELQAQEDEINEMLARTGDIRAGIEARAGAKAAQVALDSARKTNTVLDSILLLRESLLASSLARQDALDRAGRKSKLESLKAEEKALRDSFANRLIDSEQYAQKLAEIEQQRNALSIEGEAFTAAVVKVLKAAAFKGLEDQLAQSKARQAAIVQQFLGKEIEVSETFGKVMIQTGIQAGAVLAELALSGEKNMTAYLAAIVDAAFNALQALIPVFSAMILGYAIATPDAIASFGSTALIKWAALTTLLEVAVAAARAGVSGLLRAATGVVDLSGSFVNPNGRVFLNGPGTETSDSIPALLSRGESVITARGTKAGQNAAALRWLNQTGKDLAEYYAPKVTPIIVLEQDAAHVVAEMQIQQTMTREALVLLSKDIRGVKGAVETFARAQVAGTGKGNTLLSKIADSKELGY